MRLDNVSGYFDVRVYNAKKTRDQRDVASQEQTITFGTVFSPDNLPKEVSKYAHAFERKDNTQGMAVYFKCGKNCKFFKKENGRVVAIERPQHADLENVRYEACIDFRELNGDPQKQEACGYWANGILIKEAESNMFADLNEETAETPANTPADSNAEQQEGDLLF